MKVGFLSVQTHRREASIARVTVDGQDVTSRCFAADDGLGFADCFVLNDRGQKYVSHGEVAKERLFGDVCVSFPRGLD